MEALRWQRSSHVREEGAWRQSGPLRDRAALWCTQRMVVPTRDIAMANCRVIIEECRQMVPQKQAQYLEYLQRCADLCDLPTVEAKEVAARLWVALLRPDCVPQLAEVYWQFPINDAVIGVVQKMIAFDLVGATETVDVVTTATLPPPSPSLSSSLSSLSSSSSSSSHASSIVPSRHRSLAGSPMTDGRETTPAQSASSTDSISSKSRGSMSDREDDMLASQHSGGAGGEGEGRRRSLEAAAKARGISTTLRETIHIMDTTIYAISCSATYSSGHSAAQQGMTLTDLKVIQFFLTTATLNSMPVVGKNLKVALVRLAHLFLYSKQTIYQNAAKAAIIQIVNARVHNMLVNESLGQQRGGLYEQAADGDARRLQSIEDVQITFAWLCGVIRNAKCPDSLTLLVLQLLSSLIKTEGSLFVAGSGILHGMVTTHLMPTLIGPLNLESEEIFSLTIDIIQGMATAPILAGSMGAFEIICEHYFGEGTTPSTLSAAPSEASIAKTSSASSLALTAAMAALDGAAVLVREDERIILKKHLRPLANKARVTTLLRDCIFASGQVLFDIFANFDMRPASCSLTRLFLRTIVAFLQGGAHAREGDRRAASPVASERDMALKFAAIDTLQAYVNAITEWNFYHNVTSEQLPPPPSASDDDDGPIYREGGGGYDSRGVQASPIGTPRGILNQKRISMEPFDEFKRAQRQKATLAACVNAFNSSATYGLEMASRSGLLSAPDDLSSPPTLTAIVHFLRGTRGLSKRIIGEFLGSAQNNALLVEYCRSFNFASASFVGALRAFLESFRLPGESQVIERFLDGWSARLVECCPETYGGKREVLFQIAYSTIMLNTDMYSPQVRQKMTKEAFIKNTLGAIAEGHSPPDGALSAIYDEIAAEEIRLECDIVEHGALEEMQAAASATVFTSCPKGHLVGTLLMATLDGWSEASALAIERFSMWPTKSALAMGRHPTFAAFLLITLEKSIAPIIELTCAFALSAERKTVLGRLLRTRPFRLNYQTKALGKDAAIMPLGGLHAIAFLYRLISDHGSDLGSSWGILLALLSRYDPVKAGSQGGDASEGAGGQCQIDLAKLDGGGLLYFSMALLALSKEHSGAAASAGREAANQAAFIAHYGEKLAALPYASLEGMIRYSYASKYCAIEGLFALLAKGADDVLLRPFTFRMTLAAAGDHISLIISLTDGALFALLRALERYGLQSPPAASLQGPVGKARADEGATEVAFKVVETFVQIGDLLLVEHESSRVIHGGALSRDPPAGLQRRLPVQGGAPFVEDENFFLRWYHVLSGISRIAAERPSGAVSRLATRELFGLLQRQGHCYQEGPWRVIWRSIIFPLLEEAKGSSSVEDEETLFGIIQWSLAIVSGHAEMLLGDALSEVLESLLTYIEDICVVTRKTASPEYGLKLMTSFILDNHCEHFGARQWALISAMVGRIFAAYMPSPRILSLVNFDDILASDRGGGRPIGRARDHRLPPLRLGDGAAKMEVGDESAAATEEDGDGTVAAVVSEPSSPTGPPSSGEMAGESKSEAAMLTFEEMDLLARQCTMQLLFLDFIASVSVEARLCGSSPEDQHKGAEEESSKACMARSTESSMRTSIFAEGSRIGPAEVSLWLSLVEDSFRFANAFNKSVTLRQQMVGAGYAESVELLLLNRQETGALSLLVELLAALLQRPPAASPAGGWERKAIEQRYSLVTLMVLRRYIAIKRPNAERRRPSHQIWDGLVVKVLTLWCRGRLAQEEMAVASTGSSAKDRIALAIDLCLACGDGEAAHPIAGLAKEYIVSLTARFLGKAPPPSVEEEEEEVA